MVESEKTKHRKSLFLGVLSIVLLVIPFVNVLLSFFWKLFWLASFVIGMLALRTGSLSKSVKSFVLGFIGVVVSAILFLLMTFVVLLNIHGDRSDCLWRMQRLSNAIQEYCIENDRTLPDAHTWCDQLLDLKNIKEAISADVFKSGSYIKYGSATVKESGYAFNRNLDSNRLSEIDCETVLLFETDFCWNQNGTLDMLPLPVHSGYWPFYARGYHFVLVGPDSTFTVKFVKNSELDSLNWDK